MTRRWTQMRKQISPLIASRISVKSKRDYCSNPDRIVSVWAVSRPPHWGSVSGSIVSNNTQRNNNNDDDKMCGGDKRRRAWLWTTHEAFSCPFSASIARLLPSEYYFSTTTGNATVNFGRNRRWTDCSGSDSFVLSSAAIGIWAAIDIASTILQATSELLFQFRNPNRHTTFGDVSYSCTYLFIYLFIIFFVLFLFAFWFK